jgi:hypothetical protein
MGTSWGMPLTAPNRPSCPAGDARQARQINALPGSPLAQGDILRLLAEPASAAVVQRGSKLGFYEIARRGCTRSARPPDASGRDVPPWRGRDRPLRLRRSPGPPSHRFTGPSTRL